MKVQALYIRVSTEAQAEEGFSIAAQTERLEGYALAMGWEQTKLFIDGGYSGSNLERPEMTALISAVQSGQIGAVVVYKLDRLSRSQKDTLYLIEEVFLPYGVDFISVNESIDTSTPYGRAMIGIMSAFAQLERENIYMRTRMGMLERVKQGYWMGGGRVPYGYLYDKEQGILVPHPEEAEKVRLMYHLYLCGESPQQIAEQLGLAYDRLVMQILNRRSNLGLISYKGEEYQGKHEAIISQEIFLEAQQKRRTRSVGQRSGAVHLLSGLIYCGECGGRLRYVKWGKGGYKLRCYGRDPSKTYMNGAISCEAPAIWAKEVEGIVLGDVMGLSADLRKGGEEVLSVPRNYQKEIQRLQQKLKRLYHLYGQGGEDTLLETIEEVKSALVRCQEEEQQSAQSQVERDYVLGLRQRVCTLGDTWSCLTQAQHREILRECVARIDISGEKVEIRYVFDGGAGAV